MKYGAEPKVLETIELKPVEHMLYLYLPVMMPHDPRVYLPGNLLFCEKLIARTLEDAWELMGSSLYDHHVYVTAKTMYVGKGCSGNRPGWHADGFGSNGDLNYIWHDMNPTQFAIQEFGEISDDDFECLRQLDYGVDEDCIVVYPNRTLLRLDERVVHRVDPCPKEGVRTFIKVSISRHRYNLKGNSHNYLIGYDWEMFERGEVRNLDNKDFKKCTM